MAEDNLTTHVCDVCATEIHCIGIYAEFALENEWYISPFSDFCSACKNSEYALRVIETETALFERKRAEAMTT